MEDLPSREEELSEAMPGFDATLGARNLAQRQELERLAAQPDAVGTVGVCWQAAHMRAVIAVLCTHLGYHIVDASWMTAS